MFKGDQTKVTKSSETIIGPSVKVEGDFNGNGDVVVEGIVVGNLSTENDLRVGKDAKIEAEVKAENAFIAGEVSGNVFVANELELTNTAVIRGDVTCSIISIEKGAKINGKISMNGNFNTKPLKKEDQTEE